MGKRETLDMLVRHKLIRQGIADFCTHEPREPVLDIHEVARRIAALEKVVETARVICGEMKACRMPYASDVAALRTALDAEVVG